MKKTQITLTFLLILFLSVKLQAQDSTLQYKQYMTGHWTLDNKSNITKADKGNDLEIVGDYSITEGPSENNGAILIKKGSYILLKHGIAPNGGGKKINDFSIIMDIKIPEIGHMYSLYQTDLNNKDDGECFITDYGNIGRSYYTPSVLVPGEWYRIGFSVKNGDFYHYYIDGVKDLDGVVRSIDGKFSLDTAGVLLFADNNGGDHDIDVSDIMIFSKALNDKEMKDLGGFHEVRPVLVVEPDTIIHPYLQTPTDSSIYICWHASPSHKSIVEYGTTKDLGNSTSGDVYIWPDSTSWHWVKLTGLKPETVYYYRAISDTLKSDIYSFKTAPKQGENDGHIRFVIIGDTRTYPEQFTDIVTSIREKTTELYGNPNIENDLNLILNVGDIVTYGPILSQYKREWFEPLSGITANVPIMVSIGDHEHDADNYYDYMKYEDFAGPEGEKYYSFKYGRVLFIAIYSIHHLDKQLQWLDSLLQVAEADTTIDWVFGYTHRPGHSEIWKRGNEPYVQDYIIPIMSKYSKADILTYGHSHAYERGQVTDGNLRLLENGGGGAELDRWREYDDQTDYPEIQKTHDYWSYTLVDIDVKNKRYDAAMYAIGFKEKDFGNIKVDSFFRDKKNQIPPEVPILISPKNKKKVTEPIILKASEYKGKYEILSSQFQVTEVQGDYSNTVVNEKRDFENLFSDTGAPDYIPIDKNKGINLEEYVLKAGTLEKGKKYWWRVRYRDKNLQWSPWSEESYFTVK